MVQMLDILDVEMRVDFYLDICGAWSDTWSL
jgi:hypothetical protein